MTGPPVEVVVHFAPTPDSVDLLIVLEAIGPVGNAQWLLSRALVRVYADLASGDRDEDGVADVPPIRSIHAAVTTSDVGRAGTLAAGRLAPCDAYGNDGLFMAPAASCTGADPSARTTSWALPGDPIAAADELRCFIERGEAGCALEMPLEAMLKALAPAAATDWTRPDYVAPIFADGTVGHGDGANAGFSRAGSVLVVLVLALDHDMSAADPALFSDDPRYRDAGINVRGLVHPEALHPIERYRDGLLQLRDAPQHVAYFVLGGVMWGPGAYAGVSDYEDVLAEPDFVQPIDPTSPFTPITLCSPPPAVPPVRLLELGLALEHAGAPTGFGSVCAASYEPYVDDIVGLVDEARWELFCIDRDGLVAGASSETVDCDLEETLRVGQRCDELSGRASIGVTTDADGDHEVCEIAQLAPYAIGTGWFLEAASVDGGCAAGFSQMRLRDVETVDGASYAARCRRTTTP